MNIDWLEGIENPIEIYNRNTTTMKKVWKSKKKNVKGDKIWNQQWKIIKSEKNGQREIKYSTVK